MCVGELLRWSQFLVVLLLLVTVTGKLVEEEEQLSLRFRNIGSEYQECRWLLLYVWFRTVTFPHFRC